jgi:hypothetical protein
MTDKNNISDLDGDQISCILAGEMPASGDAEDRSADEKGGEPI